MDGMIKIKEEALNLALTSAAEKSLRWQGACLYAQKDRIGSKLANKLPLFLFQTV